MIGKSWRKRIQAVIIVLFCLLMAYLALHFRIEIFIYANLSKGKSLSYDKVESITHVYILGGSALGKEGLIEIQDKEVIEELFEYINGLKLVKGIGPRHSALDDEGSFGISIFGEGVTHMGCLDTIRFTTDFLRVYYRGRDWDYTDYYIKDSGYNKKDKSTNISQYIYSLLEDYRYLE